MVKVKDADIKALFKKLKELKVDRKCDAYQGIQDVVKKWTIFAPLVAELLVWPKRMFSKR